MQFTYVVLTQFGLIKMSELTHLDIFATLVAAACHDYGHDGFTNAYHVKTISDRAITYSDHAVQENYHAAESFAILNKTENNFMSGLSREEFRHFRKRFTGCILATDMARSTEDLAMFKSLITHNEVKDGVNADKLIDCTTEVTKFDS